MCHEKVNAAQFLIVGNPYESIFFAYIPRYVKIPIGKGLVLCQIGDRLSFLNMSRKRVHSRNRLWATLMRAHSLLTCLDMSRFLLGKA